MTAAAVLELAPPERTVKLDLACGQVPREGFEGVDLYAEQAQHKVDLMKFPFPWDDSSVDELWCSHFVEHLPARNVENHDFDSRVIVGHLATMRADIIGKDFLFAFFDECWRILKPDGVMTVQVPNAFSAGGFQDPTHRRFIVAETFGYLSAEWRKATKLDHYRVRCDFAINVLPLIPSELSLLHPEAQTRRMREGVNTVVGWQATMRAIK